MHSLNNVLAALDISDQIGRGLTLVRRMDNPIGCLFLAAILIGINLLLWPWIWYLDIDATREFGEAHAALIRDMDVPVPIPNPALAGALLAGGLLLPTLIEMGSPVLARYGITVAAWLFWICIAVDAYTDFPRVAAILAPSEPTNAWWQYPFFFLARMILLFFATMGLEFWFAITSIVALALILRSLALGVGGGGSRRTRYD